MRKEGLASGGVVALVSWVNHYSILISWLDVVAPQKVADKSTLGVLLV